MDRYVTADPGTMTITGGPYLWDGVAEWVPPTAGTLMREADALAAGYAYPPSS